nr:type I-MYXAN CRISPR-associated protein Cas6/Cmx6 [Tolypothrix sp. NIES-4075]
MFAFKAKNWDAPYVDLTFKLRGTPIPLDNGYVIYSALSSICPIL